MRVLNFMKLLFTSPLPSRFIKTRAGTTNSADQRPREKKIEFPNNNVDFYCRRRRR
jgi:hypothetical protein